MNSEQNIQPTSNSGNSTKPFVSCREFWSSLSSADELLTAVRQADITYQKLKGVVFGGTAIKVIKAIRKDGDEALKSIKAYHQAWYCFSVAAHACSTHGS